MKKIYLLCFINILFFSSLSINAWEESVNSGYAREIRWTFGCSNNPNRKCGRNKGTNYSIVNTPNKNRWVRSSVTRGNRVIRSPKSGISKTIGGKVWNQEYARAVSSVAIGQTNQRYHDFMKK